MKKILLAIVLLLVIGQANAQTPLVGKPSLKLVYEPAQTNKWEFSVGATNTLTINGTGGTPIIKFSDYAGTGDKLLAVDANGKLIRTSFTPSSGASFGTDNQIPTVNAGGTDFDYSSLFTFDGGTGALSLSGSFVVDDLIMDGGQLSRYTAGDLTISAVSNNDIKITPSGTGSVIVDANLKPLTDNDVRLGSSSKRFELIYGVDIRSLSSTDASNYTNLKASGVNATLSNVSTNYLNLGASSASNVDSGTTPVIQFYTENDGGAAFANRPTLAGYNYTTKQWEVAADGTWDYQGNNLENVNTVKGNTLVKIASTGAYPVQFETDGSVVASINAYGLFTLGATTDQIRLGTTNQTTISSTAPSAPRTVTLSDYGANANLMQAKSGTFTPDISPASGAFTTLTYSTQYGRYVRKQITSTLYETTLYVNLVVNALDATGASGALTINVPYDITNESGYMAVCHLSFTNIDLDAGYSLGTVRAAPAASVTSVQLKQLGDGAAGANFDVTDLTSTTALRFTLTYISL